MIYGLYNSAAGMLTTDYRQGVLANNIANADTVGFKRDIAVFAERIPASQAGRREGPSARDIAGLSGGLWLGKTHTDFAEGQKLQTDQWHDLSLDGPGFFVVQVDDGPQYTRDGRFIMDQDGWLRAATDGAPVLGRGGRPVRLNPFGSRENVRVDDVGHIFQDDALVGQLALADFRDYGALRKVGASRFVAPENSAIDAAALVHMGYVESSSVSPIHDLVNMLEASRAYQMNAQMVTLQDQTVSRLIGTALRV
jgi:flagellar basal-body rod protein FlgG